MSFSSSFVVLCFGLALVNVFTVDATPLTEVEYTKNTIDNNLLPGQNGVIKTTEYTKTVTTKNALNDPILAVRSPSYLDSIRNDGSKLMNDLENYGKNKVHKMLSD